MILGTVLLTAQASAATVGIEKSMEIMANGEPIHVTVGDGVWMFDMSYEGVHYLCITSKIVDHQVIHCHVLEIK